MIREKEFTLKKNKNLILHLLRYFLLLKISSCYPKF